MEQIIIKKPELSERKLTSRVDAPENLGKFFKSTTLFAHYDSDILADESILSIPIIAAVLPLAWLSGSDIHVGVLDRTFKESMDSLKRVFKAVYPDIPFTTEITADELVDNKIGVADQERRTGLLFSGGVDSTYSLITNLRHKPRLIMIWGCDDFSFPERSAHWELAISTYSEFAESKGLEFNLIKTNVSQILDDRRIEHDYAKPLENRRLRFKLNHSLVLIPPTAPLSVGRFDRMLIAATYASTYDYSLNPYASEPATDEKIIWADLSVKHDGAVSRTEKIKWMEDYLKNNKVTLRVCTMSDDAAAINGGLLNDISCEKCYRTILSLILDGIDPNVCGFKVDKSIFQQMKSYFLKMNMPGYFSFIDDIKKTIPDEIDCEINGAKEFFEWLKEFRPSVKNFRLYRQVYNKLPYPLAYRLSIVFKYLGINIHGVWRQRLSTDEDKNRHDSHSKRNVTQIQTSA